MTGGGGGGAGGGGGINSQSAVSIDGSGFPRKTPGVMSGGGGTSNGGGSGSGGGGGSGDPVVNGDGVPSRYWARNGGGEVGEREGRGQSPPQQQQQQQHSHEQNSLGHCGSQGGDSLSHCGVRVGSATTVGGGGGGGVAVGVAEHQGHEGHHPGAGELSVLQCSVL